MGAWNYGVFDNDTVYNALDDLKVSSNIIADIEIYVNGVAVKQVQTVDEGRKEVDEIYFRKMGLTKKSKSAAREEIVCKR